jgi:hypothetical protein
MKHYTMFKPLALLLLTSFSTPSFAGTQSCADQLADISARAAAAQSAHNDNEVSRLNIARDKVKTYCTDERQRAVQHIEDKDRKIAELESDITEAQRDLDYAVDAGNDKKIRKYTRRLEEKRAKLAAANAERQSALQDKAKLERK